MSGSAYFAATRCLAGLLLVSGLHCKEKPKPKPKRDFGPYPLVMGPVPREKQNASVLIQQVREANLGTERRIAQSLQSAGGDGGKAVDLLLPGAGDPDGAEALLIALRDLAPQGSERTALNLAAQKKRLAEQRADYETALKEWQAKPADERGVKPTAPTTTLVTPTYRFKAPEGTPGILAVARTAEALKARAGKPEAGRFDEILLADCLNLMATHGATEVPESQKVVLANRSGKASPINPAVRSALLEMMKDEGLQSHACNALGRLGDMGMVKEIIEHPHRYPGARIGAFGPDAVEAYKQMRLKKLKTSSGSEAEFWISSRLGYRDREAALDLALAGDGGAGTAVTRNVTLEAMWAKDPDERMAQAVDTYMRFPGTREAVKAGMAMVANSTCGLEAILLDGYYPKTQAATLRYFEYLMRRTFVEGKGFTGGAWGDDPTFTWGILIKMEHYKRYSPESFNKYYANFYHAAEGIFRKYYPAGKACKWLGEHFQQDSTFYALHLGLKPHRYLPPFEDRRYTQKVLARKIEMSTKSWMDRIQKGERAEGMALGSESEGLCIHLGHYRLEDLP